MPTRTYKVKDCRAITYYIQGQFYLRLVSTTFKRGSIGQAGYYEVIYTQRLASPDPSNLYGHLCRMYPNTLFRVVCDMKEYQVIVQFTNSSE